MTSYEIIGDYEKILSIGVGFAYIYYYTRKL